MMMNNSLFTVQQMMGVHVVTLQPTQILDQLQVTEIGQGIRELIETGAAKLLLDFSRVDHLSSSSLGMLLTAKKEIEAKKGRLKLCQIKPQLFEVFRITNLDKVFSIYKTADEALLSFQ
jgi:anti-sigma B factor antagonist